MKVYRKIIRFSFGTFDTTCKHQNATQQGMLALNPYVKSGNSTADASLARFEGVESRQSKDRYCMKSI